MNTNQQIFDSEILYDIPGFSNYTITKSGNIFNKSKKKWLSVNRKSTSTTLFDDLDNARTMSFTRIKSLALEGLPIKNIDDFKNLPRAKTTKERKEKWSFNLKSEFKLICLITGVCRKYENAEQLCDYLEISEQTLRLKASTNNWCFLKSFLYVYRGMKNAETTFPNFINKDFFNKKDKMILSLDDTTGVISFYPSITRALKETILTIYEVKSLLKSKGSLNKYGIRLIYLNDLP